MTKQEPFNKVKPLKRVQRRKVDKEDFVIHTPGIGTAGEKVNTPRIEDDKVFPLELEHVQRRK
jgi:hypothetical protein